MAKKTILRKANTQEIANVNEEYINMAEWTGLNDSTNYTSVDQSSFSEADNVYVDDENELRNRPPIVSTQPFETIECNDLEDNTYDRGIIYHKDTGSDEYEHANSHGSATVTYIEPESLYGIWYDAYDNTGYAIYDENDNIVSLYINSYLFTDIKNGSCTLTYTGECFNKQAPQYIRNNKDGIDTYYNITKIIIEDTRDVDGLIDPSIYNLVYGYTRNVFDACTYVTQLDINDYIDDFSDENMVFSGLGIDSSGVTVNFNYSKKDDNSRIPTYCFYSLYKDYVTPKINTINFNGDVTRIGQSAFEYNTFTSITLPNVITNIENYAFYECNRLTNIIATGVTYCGDYCFYNCTTLSIANISAATWLGKYCFYNCTSLISNLFDNVTTIPDYCFYNCTKLTVLYANKATSLGTASLNGCTGLIELYLSSVLVLPDECFKDCISLTTLDISSVTDIGDSYFMNYTSLTTIDISSATTINDYCFQECTSLTNVKMSEVNYIGSYAFYDCINLQPTNLNFSNVINIGSYAFYRCYNLSEIDLPKVQFLYMACFCECGLKRVNIGSNLLSLGIHIFEGVTTLEELTIPFIGDSRDTTATSGHTLFGYLFSGESETGLTTITQELYSDSYTMYIPTSLSKVKITKGLPMTTGGVTMQALPDYTFSNCTMLTEIDIGDDSSSEANNIGRVQYAACTGCTNLKTVKLAHYVIAISGQVFTDCTALTTIYLPLSITTIADGATRSCSALTTVYYEGSSSDKSNISFNTGNDNIRYNATWTYNYEYEV